MSAADGGNGSAVDVQVHVLRSFVLQTPADHTMVNDQSILCILYLVNMRISCV